MSFEKVRKITLITLHCDALQRIFLLGFSLHWSARFGRATEFLNPEKNIKDLHGGLNHTNCTN